MCNWGGQVFGFGVRFCWRAFGRAVLIEGGRSVGPSFVRSGGQSVSRAVLIGSGQAVERDEVDAPPVFVVVARQLRISAQIIFFQRREGVRSGKGARACGKSYHFDTLEKKRNIDFGA